jgi:hypothetical protein
MKKTILILAAMIIGALACQQQNSKNAAVNQYAAQNDWKYNSDAITNPDKFAWGLFIEINKPADPTKPDGMTVWQRDWANAEDVFDTIGRKPTWEDIVGRSVLRDINKGIPIQQLEFREMLNKLAATHAITTGACSANMPPDPLILNETKMNKATFDFIISKELYYSEGVERFFVNKEKIEAPIESKEIKALWKPINKSSISEFHYVTDGNGKYWGLVALHIISKDLPNWTWATFEHKDNECLEEAENNPNLVSKDKYGINSDGTISKELKGDFIKNGMPNKWNNYKLRGTQLDFTTPTGEPIILGNTYTENGFTSTSSCISCHSRATVGKKLKQNELPPNLSSKRRRNFFNRLDVFESNDPLRGSIGSPNPNWFYSYLPNGQKEIKFIQTDFMWSIPFRAMRKIKYQPT